MRKALLVGIDKYEHINSLENCEESAIKLKNVLERNYDSSPNFHCNSLISSQLDIKRDLLRDKISDLSSTYNEVSLLYFAGYGIIDNEKGGYLMCSDSKNNEDGISIAELIYIVNNSRSRNFIIILDCWLSGVMGSYDKMNSSINLILREGVSIMSMTSEPKAIEKSRKQPNFFTQLIIEALNGSASDLIGHITLTSIYSFLESSLAPFGQTPLLLTNKSSFSSLRNTEAKISWKLLRKLTLYFLSPDYEYPLDPSFEVDYNCPNEQNIKIFEDLRKYFIVGLIKTIDSEHLYFAAINSKSVSLTTTGKIYWTLLNEQKI